MRQEREDVGDARGRQDDLVRAGLEVGGVGRVACQPRGLLAGGRSVEIGELRRRGPRRSVRAPGPRDPVERRGRRAAGDALAGGVGERDLDALGRAEAGGLEAIRRADECRDALGAVRRLGLGRRRRPNGRPAAPRPVAQGPGQPGSIGCSRAASSVDRTRRASASSSVWLAVASATRPSRATRR